MMIDYLLMYLKPDIKVSSLQWGAVIKNFVCWGTTEVNPEGNLPYNIELFVEIIPQEQRYTI